MVAIALQMLAGRRPGVQLYQCQKCYEVFEVGPGTGRRSTKRYCSRKCQDAHRYLRNKRT
jgi:hypothetical protein